MTDKPKRTVTTSKAKRRILRDTLKPCASGNMTRPEYEDLFHRRPATGVVRGKRIA
jgi:hypothetical protein